MAKVILRALARPTTLLTLVPALLLSTLPRPAYPQAADRFAAVTIEAADLGHGIYMLTGAGGNIGLSVGDDGALLIDDQFAPLTDRIRAAVAKVTDRPIRFVINTHLHGDHTGGNEALGGSGSVIIAQENVRRRMSVDQVRAATHDTTKASPKAALPIITFTDSVALHLNGEEIAVTHLLPAHTDGDSWILFREADVAHLGDLFFNGLYPRVDLDSGGSVDGYVHDLDAILAQLDDDAKIIPGHGPLGTKKDLLAFRDMMKGSADNVRKLIAAGKSRDEVIAAHPTAAWDAAWGGGFIKPDRFAGTLFDDLSRK